MNTTKPWPATCATCHKPVRKAESHSGAPGSGVAVRHLDCAPTKTCTLTEADVRAYLHDICCPLCGRMPWEHAKDKP